MGHTSAVDMANWNPDLESAITWHLRSNHFPPHPYFMIPFAIRAVKKFNKGQWHTKVRLPADAEHRSGKRLMPVLDVINTLHLDPFLEEGAVEEYNEESMYL